MKDFTFIFLSIHPPLRRRLDRYEPDNSKFDDDDDDEDN
jgi:hypothetical protein